MSRRILFIITALLVLILGLLSGLQILRPYQFHGSIIQSPKLAPDIVLRSAGGAVQLNDYRGKVVVVYFGYTFCPDICPASLARLKQAVSELSPEEASQVQVIFISVDPDRDLVGHLEQYAHAFSPDFIGATGTRNEIDLMVEGFGAYYKINPPDANGTYSVDHVASTFVLNRNGYLVMTWPHDVLPSEVSQDLRYLLKNGVPISTQILAAPTFTPVVCSLTLIPAHVEGGQWLYEHHCAQCHGLDLKGNSAWQVELSDGSHLPPPLDNTGHAWQYSEADLLTLIKEGRNRDKAIQMPAFKNILSDWEIHFILQYIASKWDVNQRNYQAGFATLTPIPTAIYTATSTATPTP